MKQYRHLTKPALALMAAGLLAGCSGPNPKASTDAEAAAHKSEFFSVPAEQMDHVQVVTIQPTTFPRILRLTGAVAYHGFMTTPVLTQVSGPVGRIVVSPGQQVVRGQPMLYVSSPDYSLLRASYLKARDAHALAHKNYTRAEDLYAHHAIAERDLQAAESAE